MDRGGRLTFLAAAVIVAATAVVVVRGLPAELEPVAVWLPELLAVPCVLLAVRFARHRPLVLTILLLALHVVGSAEGMLTLVVAIHVVVLALVRDLRTSRPGALLHVGLASASIGVVRSGWSGGPPWLAGLVSFPWLGAAVGVAFVAAAAAAWWRRGPFEATLPWTVVAIAVHRVVALPPPAHSLVLAAAQAIMVIGLVEDGRRLAFHDRLTGLPNRRAFDDHLAGLRGDYALAMVDVDRFKSFNDRWGHEAGDQVLRMVAAELDRVEGRGRAFRYGGEEFVIVLPGMKAREATSHLEAVRAAIADRGFAVRSAGRPRRKPKRPVKAGTGRQVRVTVSIGVASPDARRTVPGDVLRAADRAMYRAKSGGRNRVVSG